ncbi:hypothetical protein ACO0RG_004668 [Hanseniaspora osmophila]|uniref:Peptide hydrolase n=1 Tax=Hanseniaspora osmophila TaxID=56408 RepID=A0A1E5RZL3_9ASCO|nr:Uncharacterized protein AWRI3579_g141 [Hanseniaspora osmophila]
MLTATILWLAVFAFVCNGRVINDFPKIDTFLSLANPTDSLLLPFNKTRIPGSLGSFEVQTHIKDFFASLPVSWTLEEDRFAEQNHNFTNLIFSLNTGSLSAFSESEIEQERAVGTNESFFVIAAHYDSKKQPEGFIGAIDSIASCSIMMYLAFHLSDQIQQSPLAPLNRGIKFVFFDGEEALEEWSETDSIYGSRHLAKKWHAEDLLGRIDAFILMDLLGGVKQGLRDVKVFPFFEQTVGFYNQLAEIEQRVNKLDSLKTRYLEPEVLAFLNYNKQDPDYLPVEDDHIPFYKLGVPILHLIPYPFPAYWHTTEDDFEHLDISGIHKWAKMLSTFLQENLFEDEGM